MTKLEQPMSFIAVLLLTFGLSQARAYFEGNHRYDGQSIVNGVDFKTYKSFPEKWKLVTTGFSADTNQLGLVYANPIAFAHLQKLKTGTAKVEFPDGAVLGRVLFRAEKDSRLQTALVPGSAREFQLMVRDASKFKSTEGWAFARFNAEGKSLNEEPQALASSCLACHALAQKEGFVFSKLALIAADAPATAKKN